MNSLTDMYLEVWTDGKSEMLSIHAETPKNSEGLHRIYFVMTREELQDIVSGRINSATDIMHRLSIIGEDWTFYDMDFPRKKNGIMNVPYQCITVPYILQKTILRVCKRVWKKLNEAIKFAEDNDIDSWYIKSARVRIPFSQKFRDLNDKLYGIGKGSIKLNFGEYNADKNREAFVKAVTEGGPTFNRSLESLKNIAKNSTQGFHQTATIHISTDADGFYWTAVSPRGKKIMNGGLVNHSRNGEHDWSVHT